MANEQEKSAKLNSDNPKDCLVFFHDLAFKELKDGEFHEFRREATKTIANVIQENESLKNELASLKNELEKQVK